MYKAQNKYLQKAVLANLTRSITKVKLKRHTNGTFFG